MSDVDTLLQSWRRSGADARRVATAFLEIEHAKTVTLPAEPRRQRSCVRLVAIAERHLAFTLRALPHDSRPGVTRESQAGVAEIADCGEGALASRRVQLAMSSPRGTVELLVVRHRTAVAPVETLLAARALGPAAPQGEVGDALELAPLAARVARAERVARNEGAKGVVAVGGRGRGG